MRGFPKVRKYTPTHPEKWINPNNIIARSNLEMKFFRKCDNNSNILLIGSEEVVIPYISIDERQHKYYIDLYLKTKDTKGIIQEYIVEIKPDKFTKTPKLPKSGRRTKGYLMECKNWLVNSCKWKAATEFAKLHNMKFIFLTEKDL